MSLLRGGEGAVSERRSPLPCTVICPPSERRTSHVSPSRCVNYVGAWHTHQRFKSLFRKLQRALLSLSLPAPTWPLASY